MQPRYHRLTLALILLAALAWRLALWAQPLHMPANDEVEYVQVARDLLAGRGWAFYTHWRWLRAPLYPLFLAGSLWLAGGDLHLAALPNLALSVALVGVVYGLARELAGVGRAGPALLAAAIMAALQTAATFASLYMSETLFALLFGLGLLSLARWQRAGGVGWAAVAGVLLGLACLTRSAGLVFVPLAGLWMLGAAWGRGGLRPGLLLPPLALGAAAALTVAPWVAYTCRAYGRCILIETGGSYNLWAFYDPHESLETINATLEAVPNPVARADLATQRGMARLREDPLIVLRKIPAEWRRLWAVNPIEDRFLRASNYSDPPPALFLSALLLDDVLYLLVLCAAPFGLALTYRRPLAILLGLWLGVFTLVTLLTHAEGRYRHFLFVALLPLAALALTRPGRGRLAPRPGLAAGVALGLALLPALGAYPWAWAGGGALRSVYRAAGDLLAASGRYAAAGDAYRAALSASETPDGWIALGDLQRRMGAGDAAVASYWRAYDLRPPYVGASAALGDLLRGLGRVDEARAAFRGQYLDQRLLIDWMLRVRAPTPTAAVDVGDGLDFGYVGGVYAAEQLQGASARWTDGRGLLRLRPPGGPGPALLTLRLAAPRPDGAPVPAQICADGACVGLRLDGAWSMVRLYLPAGGAGAIELRSATFEAADGRSLGLLIDWAKITALTPSPSPAGV